jgi:hypothetical protein
VKHWKAEGQVAELPPREARRTRLRAPAGIDRWARVDSFELPKFPQRQADLSGALVGLLLVATACAGLCFALYQVTGPTDTFAEGSGPRD